MLVAVNELSFTDSCNNDDEAEAALRELADILKSNDFKRFSGGNSQLYTKDGIKDILITNNKTLHSYIDEMFKKPQTELYTYAEFLMQKLVSTSRVIPEGDMDNIIKYKGEEIVNSSINYSFRSDIHHALISLLGSSRFKESYIETDDKYTTVNITRLDKLKKIVWCEKPNFMKHGTKDNNKRKKKVKPNESGW